MTYHVCRPPLFLPAMPRRRKPDAEFDPDAFYGGPSKSQLKRDMERLQDVGTALEELPEDKLAAVPMGERLRDALRELKRLKQGEARRRHKQFIGKLLRDEDPEPLRRALLDHRQGQAEAVLTLRQIEHWRHRLLTEEPALNVWLTAYPGSDTPNFRALVAQARREYAEDEQGGRSGRRGPYYRELFQAIHAALLEAARQR